MRSLATLLLILLGISASPADDHAVVLVYHHVSAETPALTSVTPEVFESHLDYLQDHDFTVWPLARIIDALEKGEDKERACPKCKSNSIRHLKAKRASKE